MVVVKAAGLCDGFSGLGEEDREQVWMRATGAVGAAEET